MRLLHALSIAAFSLSSCTVAASSWSFEDATLFISGKGADGVKEKLSPTTPRANSFAFSASSTLKVILTATEDKKPKRPHQAFLTLQEPASGLEESFAFSVKENGKGKVEISHKDLPFQFLTASDPVLARLVLASFGSSTPSSTHAFSLTITPDASAAPAIPSAPERYTSKPLITHTFRADPRSPTKVISLFFTLAVLASLPILLGGWLLLGGNVGHLGKAFGASPIAHSLFFGSLLGMEGVFFLYYSSWNLFQTLPVAAVVGGVAYVSGSRALTEVQARRLAGER